MWAEPRNKDTQKTGVFKSILGRVNKKKKGSQLTRRQSGK
jgi:hypothetical protein